MAHHSIAVVITSFLTNFVEFCKGEVRLSPGPEGLSQDRRGHNTSSAYYQNLMFIELRISSLYIRKPTTQDRG
jgi:hypothetical protein